MADDDTTEATSPAPESRLDRLEATQQEQGHTLSRIEEMLSHIVPGSHAEAEERTERRLDRGSELTERVRAELARRDKEAADKKAADDDRTEREQIKADLAALREKPPAPPRNPLKFVATAGWGDGR